MIIFENVTKIYDNIKVLDNINLSIKHGSFVSIIGHTGSGKTTLVNILLGFLKPDYGKILIDDIDISKLDKYDLQIYRRNIGVIFQDFKLIQNRTVYENISLALEVCEYNDDELEKKVKSVAQFTGISSKLSYYPIQLSGGEKQKVAIARAISHDPKLLIADEPTGNLDPISTKEILNLLLKINNYGYTVIITTHNVNLVNFLQKRVIKMVNGKIIGDYIGGYY